MDTILENLKQYYQSFIDRANTYEFFVGLADYMSYFLETPIVKEIFDEVMKAKHVEYDKLTQLEEQSLKELRESKEKLLKIIKGNNINADSLKGKQSILPMSSGGLLNELEQFEKGMIRISGFHGDTLETYLFDIAVGISEQGHQNLVQEFIDQNRRPQNTRGNYVFSKTLNSYHAQVKLIERAIKLELWGAFDNLFKFQNAYAEERKNTNYAEVLNKYGDSSRNYLEGRDAVDITFAAQDLRKIVDGRYSRVLDNDLHYLKMQNFRTYATRVNSHLGKELSKKDRMLITQVFPRSKQNRDYQIAAIKRMIEKDEEKKVLKKEIIADIREEQRVPEKTSRPHTIVDGKWGFLKFSKYEEKIKIGNSNSRPFRLLQCLLEPVEVAKVIDAVFEAIRLPKDGKDADLRDGYKSKNKQVSIIQNAIKELQKGNKLRDKLKFEFDDMKNKVWIKYID